MYYNLETVKPISVIVASLLSTHSFNGDLDLAFPPLDSDYLPATYLYTFKLHSSNSDSRKVKYQQCIALQQQHCI